LKLLDFNLETTTSGTDLSSESSFDSQQILNLQEEIKTLENQLKDNQSSIDLLKNNLQLTTYENEQLKQQYDDLQKKYDFLIKDNHNLTNQLTDIHRSSIEEVRLISILFFAFIFLFLSAINTYNHSCSIIKY